MTPEPQVVQRADPTFDDDLEEPGPYNAADAFVGGVIWNFQGTIRSEGLLFEFDSLFGMTMWLCLQFGGPFQRGLGLL